MVQTQGLVMALIPARGGSKNPPDKNIRSFRGKPLVVHSVEQALACASVDRTVVSTDCPKIARICRDAGAEVPFIRPAEIAGDRSTDLEVFRHALEWFDTNEGLRPEIIAHLRPTSPIRPPWLIEEGVRLLREDPEVDSVRSVVLAPLTPYKMWRVEDGYLEPLLRDSEISEPFNSPRQILPDVYWQNAHLDVTRWSTVMAKGSMTGTRIRALVMDEEFDVDIDSERDLVRADHRPVE